MEDNSIKTIRVWSFNALAAGVWPAIRRDGQTLEKARRRLSGLPLGAGKAGAKCEWRAYLL